MNILKNRWIHILAWVIALYFLVFYQQTVRAETNELFNVRVILPGMTETLDIAQTGAFPLCPHFFIFVVGKGSLGISLKNDATTSKETILMLGIALSSAGTFPIYRLGASKGIISQVLEIGDDKQPFGFVWLYCGVAFADKGPAYLYELRLSFTP